MERDSFPTFFECGRIKGYKILGFQPNLVFHNSEKEKISKTDISKFTDCINACLSGFTKNEIEVEINTPETFVVWCSQGLPFENFEDRLMASSERALKETLSGVVIVRRNFIKKYNFEFYDIVLLGVYKEFRGLGIATGLINYLKVNYPNRLFVVHPDCNTINFYIVNKFFHHKNFNVRIKDFVMFLFANKSMKYRLIFKEIQKRMFKSVDDVISLGFRRDEYSTILLYHTMYDGNEAITKSYMSYLDKITENDKYFKLYMMKKMVLYFIPDWFYEYSMNVLKTSKVNVLRQSKQKLCCIFSSVYTSMALSERKNHITDEINRYKCMYKSTKFVTVDDIVQFDDEDYVEDLNQEEKDTNNWKFQCYIYINRLIHTFNEMIPDEKLFYFFDHKLHDEYSRMCDETYQLIQSLFGCAKEVGSKVCELEKKKSIIYTQRKEYRRYCKVSLELNSYKSRQDFFCFIEYFKILQCPELLRKEIFRLLDIYKSNYGKKKPYEFVQTKFELYLLINRLILYLNKNFKEKENFFVDILNRNQYSEHLGKMIKGCTGNAKVVWYRYPKFKYFLKNLQKSNRT